MEIVDKRKIKELQKEYRNSSALDNIKVDIISKEEMDKQIAISEDLVANSRLLAKFDRINYKVEQKGRLMGRIIEDRTTKNSGYQGYTASNWQRLNRR